MNRAAAVADLLGRLEQVAPDRRALVALDGFDGAGKTWLAQELVDLADSRGSRPVVSVSIDGFHRPQAERRAAGTGPEGFYRASYRYDAFRSGVVDALHAGLPLTASVWDVATDRAVSADPVVVPPGALVVVDGIFLQRPELTDVWDAAVWVHAPLAVSVPRGNARFPGDHDPDPEAATNRRYVEGQRLYLAEADPVARATWVFDNTILDQPFVSVRGDLG